MFQVKVRESSSKSMELKLISNSTIPPGLKEKIAIPIRAGRDLDYCADIVVDTIAI